MSRDTRFTAGNVEPNSIIFMIAARLMVRFMNGAVAERNSSVNRANVIEPLHGRREKEGKKGEEGGEYSKRKASLSRNALADIERLYPERCP